MESTLEGDFFVRSEPGTVKLPSDSAREYIRTRFGGKANAAEDGERREWGWAGSSSGLVVSQFDSGRI